MRPPPSHSTLILTAAALMALAPAPGRAQSPSFIMAWGTFGTGDDQFNTPVGVAVDAQGNVYVADSNNHRIQKFTSNGDYVTQWGSHGTGDGQFGDSSPAGIAVDLAGNVFLTDTDNQRVQRFTDTGAFVTQWTSGTSTGIAMDAAGNVYVGEPRDRRVQKFTSSGTLLQDVPTDADGLTVDADGNIFVGNGVYRVFKFSAAGDLLLGWGSLGTGNGQFGNPGPVRLAIASSGLVYVVDHANSRIEVFTPDGAYVTQWGSTGSGPGQFLNPIGIAIDANDNIYVADTNNSRIQKFGPLPTPVLATSWGQLKRLYR